MGERAASSSDGSRPVRERIDGPTLEQVAADIQDVKQQIAAMSTYMGGSAADLKRATQTEPRLSALRPIYNAVVANRRGKAPPPREWLLRRTGELVTTLGCPDHIVSEGGRIERVVYRVQRYRIDFLIGDGMVTGITASSN